MQHQHCELNRNWLGEAAGDGAAAGAEQDPDTDDTDCSSSGCH